MIFLDLYAAFCLLLTHTFHSRILYQSLWFILHNMEIKKLSCQSMMTWHLVSSHWLGEDVRHRTSWCVQWGVYIYIVYTFHQLTIIACGRLMKVWGGQKKETKVLCQQVCQCRPGCGEGGGISMLFTKHWRKSKGINIVISILGWGDGGLWVSTFWQAI